MIIIIFPFYMSYEVKTINIIKIFIIKIMNEQN